MNKNRDLILNGNISKVLFKLSLPIMVGNLIQTLYQLTDAYWVGKLGTEEFAATVFVWPIVFVMMSFGIGMNIAGTAIISQYIGADNTKDAKKVAGQIVAFSFVFSLVLAVVGYVSSPTILRLLGAEGAMFTHANTYLRIVFTGMPTMFVFFAYQCVKQGQGDTLTPMILSGISVFSNMILDPIFILDGFGGLGLGLGVAGAAWATVISRAIIAVYGVYILFFKEKLMPLKLSDLKLNIPVMKSIIKVGLPSSFGQSMEGLGFMFLNAFILSYGDSTITAFGIGNKINSLVLMPAMGIGSALAMVIGQNIGADNMKRVKEAFRSSIMISCSILMFGGLIIFSAAPYVVGIFTEDPEVLEQGVYYLKLISITIPLMGIFQSFIGTFQGAGKTTWVMLITAGRLWAVRLPLIWYFAKFTSYGEKTVWYSMVVSNLITCIVGYAFYLNKGWQKKIIEENNDPDKTERLQAS